MAPSIVVAAYTQALNFVDGHQAIARTAAIQSHMRAEVWQHIHKAIKKTMLEEVKRVIARGRTF